MGKSKSLLPDLLQNEVVMNRISKCCHNTKRAKSLTKPQLIDELIRIWGDMPVESWDASVLDATIQKLKALK